MTTQEIVDEVLGFQFNVEKYTDRIVKWADKAQRRIVRETDIPTQKLLSQNNLDLGVYDYSLPDNFARLITTDIFITSDKEATFMKTIPLEQYALLPDSQGRPEGYILKGWSGVSVYPAPDREDYFLDFLYYKLPATLSIDDPVVNPELAEDYDELLVDYALFRAFAAEHDTTHSQYHKNLFEAALYKLKGEEQHKDLKEVQQVSGTWGNLNC